ncbi:hypothetical protein IC582_025622 [Cucumis melo]
MRNILLPIRELVPFLLDSIGFFASRGGSSTHKETELNHMHSVSIRFWFDCGSVCGSVWFSTIFLTPLVTPYIST